MAKGGNNGKGNRPSGGIGPGTTKPANDAQRQAKQRAKKQAQRRLQKKRSRADAFQKTKVRKATNPKRSDPFLTGEQQREKMRGNATVADRVAAMARDFAESKIRTAEAKLESATRQLKDTVDEQWSSSSRGLGYSSIRDGALADIQARESVARQQMDSELNRLEADNAAAEEDLVENQRVMNEEFDRQAIQNAKEANKGLANKVRNKDDVAKKRSRIAARTGNYAGIARKDQKNVWGGKRWKENANGGLRLNDKGWRLRQGENRKRPWFNTITKQGHKVKATYKDGKIVKIQNREGHVIKRKKPGDNTP